MSKLIHNGVRYGKVRYNFKVTNPRSIGRPTKIIFTPEKHVKGTPYYFEPLTLSTREIQKLPNFGKMIDERLRKEKQKTAGHILSPPSRTPRLS